jgi:hypothetical protein
MGMLSKKFGEIGGPGCGVGREFQRRRLREAPSVVANDFDASLEAAGRDSDPNGATSVVDDSIDKFRRIDAVVNSLRILRNDSSIAGMGMADA